MIRNVEDAYLNINRNIQVVIGSEKLTPSKKEEVLNAIDKSVFETIEEKCDLPE